jgi:FkbM family methyltransferase
VDRGSMRNLLIDVATRLRLDGPLLKARAALSRQHGYAEEERELHDVLVSTLNENSNCIDIGAYRGRVLDQMVRLAPHGRHIAYEPLPHLYRQLVTRFPSVDVRHAAVSNAPGETTFVHVRDAPALSGLTNRWNGGDDHRTETITVRVEALDAALPPGYVPDFIKVDVEGAERLVFEGAIKTITEHKPTILFEHGKGGADHYATEPADVYDLLTRVAGLRIFELGGNEPLTMAQFEEAYRRNEQWNFVARA